MRNQVPATPPTKPTVEESDSGKNIAAIMPPIAPVAAYNAPAFMKSTAELYDCLLFNTTFDTPNSKPPMTPHCTDSSALSITDLHDCKAEKIQLPGANCYCITVPPKDTPQYEEFRREMFNASEASGLLGVNNLRYCSRIAILRAKQGFKKELDLTTKIYMTWGSCLESAAAAVIQNLYPESMSGNIGVLRHKEFQKFQGEPDLVLRAAGGYIPVEIKTVCYPAVQEAFPIADSCDISPRHIVQLQCYCELLNAEFGLLMFYTLAHGYRLFYVPRNTEFFRKCVLPVYQDFILGTLLSKVNKKEKIQTLDYVRDIKEHCIPVKTELK